jgi:hypothetical protein
MLGLPAYPTPIEVKKSGIRVGVKDFVNLMATIMLHMVNQA